MKNKIFLIIILCNLSINTFSVSDDNTKTVIIIETSYGNMEVLLYDETPLHKENMLKLIVSGFYNDQLFHRVINNFMIQGGDPHSVGAEKGQRLGTGSPGYTIPPEFNPKYYHKKGVIAAARKGDRINPEKKSSGSQFYIVHGEIFTEEELSMMQSSEMHDPFTKEQIKAYTTIGGTPHLDGSYTVFGEVIKGLEIIDKIAGVGTDNYDRPLEDVKYSIRIK